MHLSFRHFKTNRLLTSVLNDKLTIKNSIIKERLGGDYTCEFEQTGSVQVTTSLVTVWQILEAPQEIARNVMCSGPQSGCGITKWKHGCAFRSWLCVKFGFLIFAIHISKQKLKRKNWGYNVPLYPLVVTPLKVCRNVRKWKLFFTH